VAIYFLKESAQRPLPGSMPSVDTQAEARELVAGQDDNPLIDLAEMPFETQDITTASAAADKVPAGAN